MCDTYSWIFNPANKKIYYFNNTLRKKILENGGTLKVFRNQSYTIENLYFDSHSSIITYFNLEKVPYLKHFEAESGILCKTKLLDLLNPYTWDLDWFTSVLNNPAKSPTICAAVAMQLSNHVITDRSKLHNFVKFSVENREQVSELLDIIKSLLLGVSKPRNACATISNSRGFHCLIIAYLLVDLFIHYNESDTSPRTQQLKAIYETSQHMFSVLPARYELFENVYLDTILLDYHPGLLSASAIKNLTSFFGLAPMKNIKANYINHLKETMYSIS